LPQGSAPFRSVTDEVSLCGCYIETMFTLDVGTKVVLILWIGDEKLHTTAVVATRYPQVGNGLDFIDMTPGDRLKLNQYISEARGQ
jgi:hypothetical protein